MIGSAQDDLGRAASAEPDGKKPGQEQPGEELEKMENENEHRVEALKGTYTSPLSPLYIIPGTLADRTR